MNKQIDDLEKNLLDVINSCGLPVGVAYFVVKDLLNELRGIYAQAIEDESKPENQPHEETMTVEVPPVKEETENE